MNMPPYRDGTSQSEIVRYNVKMKSIQDLFEKYELSSSDIDKLQEEARNTSIGCGQATTSKGLQSQTWAVFDNLASDVWYSDKSNLDKIDLGFQLFDKFPNYFLFLVPFYRRVRDKDFDSGNEKNLIWKKFMDYLGSEPYYADPVAYVLWVEFFEDKSTAQETWKGLMNYKSNKKALLRLIESSGPVPFELKEPVYQKLLTDTKNHNAIFKSLLFSSYDIYGQIDNEKARILLSKLNVSTDTDDYQLLKKKINAHST